MSILNEPSPSSFGGGGGPFIRGSCDVLYEREGNMLEVFTHRKYFGDREPASATIAASKRNNRSGEESYSSTLVDLEWRVEPQGDAYARPHHPR